MTGHPQPRSPPDEHLRRAVARLLREHLQRPVRIERFERRPATDATGFPADVLRVSLAGGDQLSLFVKHLDSTDPDHPDKQSRRREIAVYRQLFTGVELPVPRCFGSCRNEAGDGDDLFLEFREGRPLNECPLEQWLLAAEQLGRLHGAFSNRRRDLDAAGFLQRFDVAYFRGWTERASVVIAARSPVLGARLQRLFDDYRPVLAWLLAGPVTLVHNDLAPQNVIVGNGGPARVCFVDWELAGLGNGLLDLAHLSYGFAPPAARQLAAAYRAGWADAGPAAAAQSTWLPRLTACALHKTVYRLARSQVRQATAGQVQQWVAEAESLFTQITDWEGSPPA